MTSPKRTVSYKGASHEQPSVETAAPPTTGNDKYNPYAPNPYDIISLAAPLKDPIGVSSSKADKLMTREEYNAAKKGSANISSKKQNGKNNNIDVPIVETPTIQYGQIDSIKKSISNHENNNVIDAHINVYVRVRPIPEDKNSNEDSSLTVYNEGKSINCRMDYDEKSFTFQKIFDVEATQNDVFDSVRDTIVAPIFDGFNACIMSYGQTGSGKTFTMEGPSLSDSKLAGITPRSVNYIYDRIARQKYEDPNILFEITVSLYEIYCEKINDLLNIENENLSVRETKLGWIVKNITEVDCVSRESLFQLLEVGNHNRKTAATFMNAESSRSHRVFSLSLTTKNLITKLTRRGTLFLVDLAGSEKVAKTGVTGIRLEEAKKINTSLSTLGQVIQALCNDSNFVPYRDSKLTLVLRNTLGGNSKTALIICCSSEKFNEAETISTLRFGERARKVKTHLKLNETYDNISVQELQAQLLIANEEIKMLREKVAHLEANNSFNIISTTIATPSTINKPSPNKSVGRRKTVKLTLGGQDTDDMNKFLATTENYNEIVSWLMETKMEKDDAENVADLFKEHNIYIIPQLVLRLAQDPEFLGALELDQSNISNIQDAIESWRNAPLVKLKDSEIEDGSNNKGDFLEETGKFFVDAGVGIKNVFSTVGGSITGLFGW